MFYAGINAVGHSFWVYSSVENVGTDESWLSGAAAKKEYSNEKDDKPIIYFSKYMRIFILQQPLVFKIYDQGIRGDIN